MHFFRSGYSTPLYGRGSAEINVVLGWEQEKLKYWHIMNHSFLFSIKTSCSPSLFFSLITIPLYSNYIFWGYLHYFHSSPKLQTFLPFIDDCFALFSFPLVGSRNNPPLSQDPLPVGRHSDWPAWWPLHSGEASQEQTEANHPWDSREARSWPQGSQICGVLSFNTGKTDPLVGVRCVFECVS